MSESRLIKAFAAQNAQAVDPAYTIVVLRRIERQNWRRVVMSTLLRLAAAVAVLGSVAFCGLVQLEALLTVVVVLGAYSVALGSSGVLGVRLRA